MKAIDLDDLSNGISRLVFAICALLCVVAAFLIAGVLIHQSQNDREFNAACRTEAINWNSQLNKLKSNSRAPSIGENLATELARARIACPNGHSLIDERRIPIKILELSKDERIVEAAKRQLARI